MVPAGTHRTVPATRVACRSVTDKELEVDEITVTACFKDIKLDLVKIDCNSRHRV